MAVLDELKEELAKACRIIGRLHLTREPNGHVSVRVPGSDLVLVKARGPDEAPLSYTTASDLAVIDMDGNLVEGRDGLARPAEVFIHTEVLRARPELNSVIHIHPPNIVAYTIANKPILPIVGAYNPAVLRMVDAGIPTYPRSILINSKERGGNLTSAMGTARICLMRAHGITSAGATVEEATLNVIHLNDLAELQFKADLLGGAVPISEDDKRDILDRLPADVRQPGDKPRVPSSEWRYYSEAYG
ncbi:MAG TPA: class II aldolase/adducin family protein [Dehalococcoidia bacterium]|nr:class II aldolase/adducin family protein [Dehalococcoidia bacterium]